MPKAIIAALLLPFALTACAKGQSDRIAYSAEVDDAKDIVNFTCKDSSSGKCIFRFDNGNAEPQSLTVAKGEIAGAAHIGAGSTYCMTTGTPGAECKGEVLQPGLQTIHHEKKIG